MDTHTVLFRRDAVSKYNHAVIKFHAPLGEGRYFLTPKYKNFHFLNVLGPSTRLRAQNVCHYCTEHPFVVLDLRGGDRDGKEIVVL
jgi:hypothetical protein